MKNNNQSLTPIQLDVLVGTMLGDSKLEFTNFTRASFACEQSSIHKDYLYSLFDVFKNLCVITEPVKYSKYDKRYHKNYVSYYFSTPVIDLLGPYAELFYVNKLGGGKLKIVPNLDTMMNLLTPRALAYWIMDDGQYVARGGLTLCTDGFTLKEVNRLVTILETKYDFKTFLHKKNQSWRIYIKAESLPILRHTVLTYMHPDFTYKLDK